MLISAWAEATVPTPSVAGPIASVLGNSNHNYTFFASDLGLASRGYVEQEYFYSGTANSYDATIAGGIGARATPSTTANIVTSGNPYKTRMVVRRPSDPAKFNGIVVVEWLNATSNYDVEALWLRSHEFLMREGYAWVGITAQSVTITNATLGLKAFSPDRYGSLDLTAGGKFTSGDPLSYDVYAQGIQAIRSGAVLGSVQSGLKKIIAAGVSQSAGRVSVFLNAVQPRDTPVVDAALLYIGGEKLRTDLPIPVMKLLTENEYVAPSSANEITSLQPDTNLIRTWSITGASHSDWESFAARYPLLQRDQPTAALFDSCSLPSRSRVPDRFVQSAAIDWLRKWSLGLATPPGSPTITLGSDGVTVQRDSRGIALGGIRLAPLAVPVALDQGYNTGNGTCFLNGYHLPFDTATLNALYPTHAGYFSAFQQAADANVKAGYVLPADQADMVADAQHSIYGMGTDCGTLCKNVAQFPIQGTTELLRDHTKFLYMHGGDELLKSVDAATLSVSRGYAASNTSTKKTQFSQAAKWLQQYQSQVNAQLSAGNVTTQQASLLSGYAGQLITQLEQLGADPSSVALDMSAVNDLWGTPGGTVGGGGCTIGNGRFDPTLIALALFAAFGLMRRRKQVRLKS
ncbi:alpha/beta hydrolase domain-containing protein [Paraburkholderia ginsengisoli]|uniref:JDVT-CTERM domain-containing protein n=1 Tax=Paraburkholderia ginsengisoli TaxID=311231 RepID=A0A7T4NA00_9BURK|nr:alpha/beta hydrolase domain-containing protein [Paraburkholderia ginsengisoli]QQC67971.1 JDVT-CTERM domain-containing protein [Paraburkholderia ginsengisoli]